MSVSAEEQRSRLSLAFLSHQVQQLESSVDSLHFSRDPRLYDPRHAAVSTRNPRGNQQKREKRIVDCSAFLYALPVLKRWIREDTYQIIVPLQVISTLDILKKAPTQLHGLAREATRFLDSQLAIAGQIVGEARAAGMTEKKDWDSRVRLRAQEAREELSWTEVGKRFVVGVEEREAAEAAAAAVEYGGEEAEPTRIALPVADDVPRGIRSTLQCALYFQDQDPTSTTILYDNPALSLPSLPIPSVTPESSIPSRSQPPPIDFLALASGNALAHWSTSFSHPTTSIGSSEIVAAREWAKVQAAALKESQSHGGTSPKKGHGRGSGSTGRGGGRGGGGTARGGGRAEEDGINRRGGGTTSRGRGRGEDRTISTTIGRGSAGDGPVTGRGRGGTLFIP